MKHPSEKTYPEIIKQEDREMTNSLPKVDMIVIGIATGVAASAIIQTSKGIIATLAKNPLILFGFGIASGIVAHKYRKEIIAISSQIGEEGKDFVLRQQQGLKDILTASQEDIEKS